MIGRSAVAPDACAPCACADAVRRLEADVRELRHAVLAGGQDRQMTIRTAHEEGRFPYAPRTVESWRGDPDLRHRWRLDLLLERVGSRYFTTPARIEAWRLALVGHGKKAATFTREKTRPRAAPEET